MKTEVYWIEGNWSGRLAIVARPRGNDWLEDEIKNLWLLRFNVVVSLLTDDEMQELGLSQEEKLCKTNGLDFISFPIIDRSIPSSKWDALELVEKLLSYLIQGKNVGIHCRQSVGRSSLIVISLLITSGLDIETALQRVRAARGCSVPETTDQLKWIINLFPDLTALAVHS